MNTKILVLALIASILFASVVHSSPPKPECQPNKDECPVVANQYIAFLSQEEALFNTNGTQSDSSTLPNPFNISSSNPFFDNPYGAALFVIAPSDTSNDGYEVQFSIALNGVDSFSSIELVIGERCESFTSVAVLVEGGNDTQSNSSSSDLTNFTGSFTSEDLTGSLNGSDISAFIAALRRGNIDVIVLGSESSNSSDSNNAILRGNIFAVGKSQILLDVYQTLSTQDNLNLLVRAIQVANLTETLKTTPNITLFAPNNKAIRDAIRRFNIDLNNEQDIPVLQRLLQYHIIQGVYTSGDFFNNTVTLTPLLPNTNVTVTGDDECNYIVNEGQADIAKPDILASNGVINIVNAVLLPQNITVITEGQ